MPGKTGKRAKPPGLCYRCGQRIITTADYPYFERDTKGDSHNMRADGTYPCIEPPKAARAANCEASA